MIVRESGVGDTFWFYLISKGIHIETVKGSTRARRRQVWYARRGVTTQVVRVVKGHDGIQDPGVREGVNNASHTINPARPDLTT